IRTMFRQMSMREKTALLSELISDPGRGAELAAILKGPRSLSGLSALQVEQYTSAYRSTHCAAELAEEQMVEEVAESGKVLLSTAAELASAYQDEKRLADIQAREAAAAEAALQ